MKRVKIRSCVVFIFLLSLNVTAFTQNTGTIRGVVRDLSSNHPIPNVSIISLTDQAGALSDANGTFTLELKEGIHRLSFSHVAFCDSVFTLTVATQNVINMGAISLIPKVIGLDEVHVISSFVSERGTPVAVTTISAKTIESRTGNHDYPEILKLVPGVYATKSGGGSGDDRLTIRGFQQENIALLLNGVPVSSMENGLVYWSNWSGLTDATEAIQVQRGLGASNIAMNSVGGTVNIITKSTHSQPGGTIRYSVSDYGNQKTMMQLSSGRLKSGTAVTFLGSRMKGEGYVDGTYVDGWAYFLSVTQEINSKHMLVLTALGSPERHGQRNYASSIAETEQFGTRYNSSWGIYKGKVLNLSENFYHKPQVNLNHYWNVNDKLFVATSAYVSFGNGGGRYTEAFNYGPSLWYMTKNNQVDFESAYQDNLFHQDSFQISNGQWIKNYSKNVLTNYRANHYWYGILSSLDYRINKNLHLKAGIHARSFKSHLYEEIDDLMGGNVWIEQYAWSLSGISGRDQLKYKGDIINVDNLSLMDYGNLFGQIEYDFLPWKAFFASTISATSYQRKDPYNYTENPYSEKIARKGFDMKAGLSRKLNANGTVYANAGFYSREPYFKFVFVNFSNAVARDLRNEKITASELGYEYSNGRISGRINAYYTLWKDKAALSRENIQLADSSMTRALVRGLNALHRGVELELGHLLFSNLSVSSSVSIGDWKWQNDVVASIYDDNQVLVDSTMIYIKGLFVGDAPQTQIGISADYSFLKHFKLSGSWVYYDRLYSNFEPSNRTDENDRLQPYRIPAYGLFDLYLAYDQPIRESDLTLQLSCQNLMNKEVISRGEDGINHDASTFRGFWTQGRTFNLSLKLSF